MDKYVIAPPSGSTQNSVGAEDRPWEEGHFDNIKLGGGDLANYLSESTGYGIVSGCEPTISGLTVTVGAGVVHLADGTRKEIAETSITLDNADSTNPRIDLVYIDSTGVVEKVTGTAAASPVVPTLPSGGISVCNVTIAAGATTGTIIYDAKTVTTPLPFFNSMDKFTEVGRLQFTSGYTSTQGMCYNSKTKKLVISQVNADNTQQILMIVDPNTLQVENSYTYTELAHAYMLTYNPYTDKIYIPTCNKILNASTMEVLDITWPFATNLSSITYDYVMRVYVGIYFPGMIESSKVLHYVIYDDDATLIRDVKMEIPAGYSVLNGAVAHDGHLILNAFDGFYEVDYYGHLLSQIKTGSKSTGSANFTDLEFEDVTYIGNGIYITNINMYESGYKRLAVWEYDTKGETYNTASTHLREKIGLDTSKALYNIDLNEAVLAGKYYVDCTQENAENLHFPYVRPNNYAISGILEVSVVENHMIKQVFRRRGDGNGQNTSSFEVFTRQNVVPYNTWTAWDRIDALRSLPVSNRISITISSGSATYTATEDGYIGLRASKTTNAEVYINESRMYHWRSPSVINDSVGGTILVRKGETVSFKSDTSATVSASFSPMEGL